MNKLTLPTLTATALLVATSVSSATLNFPNVNGETIDMDVSTADLSFGQVDFSHYEKNRILNHSKASPSWGEDLLKGRIKSQTPRYQKLWSGGDTMRQIYQRSENGGRVQECVMTSMPNDTSIVSGDQLKGLSQPQIVQAFANGKLKSLGVLNEQAPSNAQFSASSGDYIATQAGRGHGDRDSFMAVNSQIIDGSAATDENNGNRYMSQFENGLTAFVTGQPVVTIQQTYNNFYFIQSYDETIDQTQDLAACEADLKNPETKAELKAKEAILVTFNALALPKESHNYDSMLKSTLAQARGETADDIANGNVHDIKLVVLADAKGVFSRANIGLEYKTSDNPSEALVKTSFGCYLKKTVDTNGQILSMDVSYSTLDNATSCTGGTHARYTVPGYVPPRTNVGVPSGGIVSNPPRSDDRSNRLQSNRLGFGYLSGGSGDTNVLETNTQIVSIFEQKCKCGVITPETPHIAAVSVGPAGLFLLSSLVGFAVLRRRQRHSQP